ncbi:MAG: RsiV family protein [Muribaculaceae bacterium]|nr:RsiV family protein [Muribaculaceae bacterium]
MKKITAAIIVLAIIAGGVILTIYMTTRSDEREITEEVEDIEEEFSEDISGPTIDWEHYYGDTLFQYGNHTVCMKYGGAIPGDGVQSTDGTILITLTDSIPTDTCIIGTYSNLRINGNHLLVNVGADTLRLDMRKLPKTIDPVKSLMVKGFKRCAYRYDFALSDSSFTCEFYFQAYLPRPVPLWTKQFIATILNADVTGLYSNRRRDKTLSNYYGLLEGKTIDGLDISGTTTENIAAYYARMDSRLYAKEYKNNDANPAGMGPKYDYMLTITPVWVNADTTLITYRFHSFSYIMGAHGMPEEYFLTFNAVSGKLLGWNDLFSQEDFQKAIAEVGRQLNNYKESFMELEETYPVSLGEEDLYTNISSVLKEKFNDRYYPRPALTNNGIIFSYQPYEAGSFSEGILHYVIPYDDAAGASLGTIQALNSQSM